MAARYQLRISQSARRDMLVVARWSLQEFGVAAAKRYDALLAQGLRDIAEDPECPGSRERAELSAGVRSYHLRLSRNRVSPDIGTVRHARHALVYRVRQGAVEVLRMIHDSQDLERHLVNE